MSVGGNTRSHRIGRNRQMPLKLRVISEHHKALGPLRSRLFGVTGGTIGRAPDNDWVLPDQHHFISGHHAAVKFHAGSWVLEDTSRNGVYLNDNDAPISTSGAAKLSDGDRLRIGEYEVLVTIDDHSDFSPDASGQMPIPPALREPEAARQSRAQLAPARQSVVRSEPKAVEFKLDSFLKPDLEVTDLLVPAKRGDQRKDDASNSASIRLNVDGFAGASEALADFCRGLGVDPSALPRRSQSALFTTAGYLLRETAMQLTRTLRQQVERAGLDAADAADAMRANPLGASPSYESTMYRLFEAPGMDDLKGPDALRDAFERIRDRDDAFDAAMAVAIDELLSKIDPARLATRVDQTSTASPFGVGKKSKYWDAFSDVFAAIDQRDERGWPTILAREFAKALAAPLRRR